MRPGVSALLLAASALLASGCLEAGCHYLDVEVVEGPPTARVTDEDLKDAPGLKRALGAALTGDSSAMEVTEEESRQAAEFLQLLEAQGNASAEGVVLGYRGGNFTVDFMIC